MKAANKIRKTEIKYNIKLTEEQKIAKAGVYDKDVSIFLGGYGSGKTQCAVLCALDLVFKGHLNKIYITRPIDFTATGYLTGPQPLYSKILTPEGWSTIKDIKVGDSIIGKDGKTYNVLNKSVINIEPVYEVETTDGRIMRCSRYHLFHTLTYNDKKHRLDKVKYLKDYNGSVKTLDEILNTLKTNKNKINHYLPYNKPVVFNTKPLPIDPYLLGVLLGDGSLSSHIEICNPDIEIIERCKRILKKQGLKVRSSGTHHTISNYINVNNKPGKAVIIEDLITKDIKIYKNIGEALKHNNINKSTLQHRCLRKAIIDNVRYSFGDKEAFSTNKLINDLQNMNLLYKKAYNKKIPDLYMYNSSVEQRIELLRGLMDTDGTVNKKGKASYTTTSKELVDNIVELVQSLGGRAKYYIRDRRGKTSLYKGKNITIRNISYEIIISTEFNPFYVSRKRERYKFNYSHLIGIKNITQIDVDKVQCIKTSAPDGLYITDNYVVTHNSVSEKMYFHTLPLKINFYSAYGKDKIDKLFTEGKIEIVPIDYLKGVTFLDAITIVDEFEDITYDDFKLILTRLGKGSKLIFTGSEEQIGIKNSCIPIIKKLENCSIVNFHTFKEQHRNDDIQKIIDFIENE